MTLLAWRYGELLRRSCDKELLRRSLEKELLRRSLEEELLRRSLELTKANVVTKLMLWLANYLFEFFLVLLSPRFSHMFLYKYFQVFNLCPNPPFWSVTFPIW